MIKQASAATSTSDDGAAEPRAIGGIRIAKVVYEHHTLYGSSGGDSYGAALDDIIRNTFMNDPDTIIQSFNIEIGEEAAAALRDRCNRGEY